MGNKAVGSYPSVTQFVPECFMSQEMYNEAVNICPFVCIWFCSWSILTQKICDKVVSKETLMLK